MSDDNEAVDTSSSCASCGIAEIDDIKLVPCDGCDLVHYCGVACQELHRPDHAEKCRKRAVEMRDELLFKQPEGSCYGDCPICCLPIPLDLKKSSIMTCCSKFVCNGCALANARREREMGLANMCPFCREPALREEMDKQNMKRIEVNDPHAIHEQGVQEYDKGDYRSAFEYWTKAVELGNVESHCKLGNLHLFGQGVEKDEGKLFHHWEEAAIGGHPYARHNLGAYEWQNGSKERAVKHWIIAATQGLDESIKILMGKFREGHVSKEDLDATLRAHKAAVDTTKSPQRNIAEEFQNFQKVVRKR